MKVNNVFLTFLIVLSVFCLYETSRAQQPVKTWSTPCQKTKVGIKVFGMFGQASRTITVPVNLWSQVQVAGSGLYLYRPRNITLNSTTILTLSRLLNTLPNIAPNGMMGYSLEYPVQAGPLTITVRDNDLTKRTAQGVVLYYDHPDESSLTNAGASSLAFTWGGDNNRSYVGPTSLTLSFPTPLTQTSDVHLNTAFMGKSVQTTKDKRQIVLNARASWVNVTKIISNPNELKVNNEFILLPDVPAGTSQVVVTLASPRNLGNQLGTDGAGDAAFLLGASAHVFCSGGPTTTPTPSNTPTPTNTPTPSNTPTPTNTPTPSNTPTPMPSNTPTPTNTPLPWQITALPTVNTVTDADTGMRPLTLGYSFANYTNVVNSTDPDFTLAQMIQWFGQDVVCQAIVNGKCEAKQTALLWNLKVVNSLLAKTGRCDTMAVTSLRFWKGLDSLSSFQSGATTAYDLAHPDNLEALRHHLGAYFALRILDPVTPYANISALESPNLHLKQIAASFQNGMPDPVIVELRSGSSTHTVVPYAIEVKGDGIVWVLVYDPNMPGVGNRIVFNQVTNTWSFLMSTGETWTGTTTSNGMAITPISLYAQPPTCPPFLCLK